MLNDNGPGALAGATGAGTAIADRRGTPNSRPAPQTPADWVIGLLMRRHRLPRSFAQIAAFELGLGAEDGR